MDHSKVTTGNRTLWYKLFFSHSEDKERANTHRVSIRVDPSIMWDQLRHMLLRSLNLLRGFDTTQLKIYENESKFEDEVPFDPSEPVGNMVGSDHRYPLIILAFGHTSIVNNPAPVLPDQQSERNHMVWYIVYADISSESPLLPLGCAALKPSQLVNELRERCARLPSLSINWRHIEDFIRIYDMNKTLLDMNTAIVDLRTTPELPLRVVIPQVIAVPLPHYATVEWTCLNPTTSLDRGGLSFVDRDTAVRCLLRVCINNDRAKDGPGLGFQIGFIAQQSGMGKSDFGMNFIHECAKVEAEAFPGRNESLNRITKSRTLRVRFTPGSLGSLMKIKDGLVRIQRVESALVQQILTSVKTQVGRPLRVLLDDDLSRLRDEPKTSEALLQLLIYRTGGAPIFIVLDEFGAAFEGTGDGRYCRELFMEFCNQFLISWLELKGLYFLIIGRGSIFEWVADRPISTFKTSTSPFEFTRISLNMIRRAKVQYILEHSRADCSPESTAVSYIKYYGLNKDEEHAAVEAILEQTNGHPRSIGRMLSTCTSKDELLAYKNLTQLDSDPRDLLLTYRESLLTILSHVVSKESMNISTPIEGRRLTLEQLVDIAKIRWEGPSTSAILHASQGVLHDISVICSSFRDYLSIFVPNRYFIFKWDRHFEIFLIKRLQEMFDEPICPSKAYPKFFPDTSPFGKLEAFQAVGGICGFPKITTVAKASESPTPESRTVHPDNWYKLLNIMVEKGSGCFLPGTESHSSDGYIVYTDSTQTKLTVVGIAAKCMSAPLPTSAIDEEIKLFNETFTIPSDAPPGYKRNLGIEELHVLMIFCTGGFPNKLRSPASEDSDAGPELSTNQSLTRRITRTAARQVTVPTITAINHTFNNTLYSNVHSALLIDLSTPSLRSEFFNISGDPVLQSNLEFMTNNHHAMRHQAHLP